MTYSGQDKREKLLGERWAEPLVENDALVSEIYKPHAVDDLLNQW